MKKLLCVIVCFILVLSAAPSNIIASSSSKSSAAHQRVIGSDDYLYTAAVPSLGAKNISAFSANNASIIETTNETDDSDALYADDRVIVKLKTTDLNARSRFPSEPTLDLGISVNRTRLINPSKRKVTIRSEITDRQNNTFVITLKNTGKQAVQDAINRLNANPNVEYATPDYYIKLNAIRPNDPMYSQQWGLETIQAPKAWDKTTGSATVVVGIIDSGIDGTHPDLISNLWRNFGETVANGVDTDGNGYIDDLYGFNFISRKGGVPTDAFNHGTHVAGIVGATGNNGTGVTGVNWNVKVAWLGVVDASGAIPESAAVEAINYAQNMGITILNASWGGDRNLASLRQAIANYSGLFVTAAGNDGRNNSIYPSYPANYDLPNIISVAGTNQADRLADFSNYGQNVHIAAPGASILSTYPNNRYQSISGTSMASPMVAGAAALVKSVHPEYTTAQIKSAILNNADVLTSLSTISGGRRLNVGFLFDEPVVEGTLYGDFTGDKYVDTTDILWIRRYIASGRSITAMRQNYQTTIDTFNEKAGDFTHNGRVDGTDILWIQRYIASGRNVGEMLRNYPTTIDFSHLM